MKTLAKYFLQGLLYITPISVTVYVLYWTFLQFDKLLGLEYPGVGILLLLIIVTLIGWGGSALIQLPFFNFFKKLLNRVPLFKSIYSSVKDIIEALIGQKKGFNKPVLVKLYEHSDIRRIGFVTDEGLTLLKSDIDLVTVYLPHSFAISGQLFLMPPDYIQPIEGRPTDIMKYIVAGGITSLGNGD